MAMAMVLDVLEAVGPLRMCSRLVEWLGWAMVQCTRALQVVSLLYEFHPRPIASRDHQLCSSAPSSEPR